MLPARFVRKGHTLYPLLVLPGRGYGMGWFGFDLEQGNGVAVIEASDATVLGGHAILGLSWSVLTVVSALLTGWMRRVALDRELLEQRERGGPGAEVVEREAHAHVADLADR